MKFKSRLPLIVGALSVLLLAGAYFNWQRTDARSAKAAVTTTTATSVEYLFTNNGISFGSDPAPLQIVQVTSGGTTLPIGTATTGAANLLDGVQVKVRNSSAQEITTAALRIDVIDPSTNRILATLAGLTLSTPLASGQERTGSVTASGSQSLRDSLAGSGRPFQRVSVQVDFVVMSNATSWKYGLLHRVDPDDPATWVPIKSIGQKRPSDKQSHPSQGVAVVEKVALRRGSTRTMCDYFGGYRLDPRTDCPFCNVYDEIWTPQPNGFAYSGDTDWNCPGGGVCTKKGYLGACP